MADLDTSHPVPAPLGNAKVHTAPGVAASRLERLSQGSMHSGPLTPRGMNGNGNYLPGDLASYQEPLRAGGEPEAISTLAKPENTCGCGALSAPPSVGPFIRCTGWDPASNSWTGTVLFVCKPDVCEIPKLSWSVTGCPAPPTEVEGLCLDVFCEWNFWRFELRIPVTAKEQVVQYWMSHAPSKTNTFYVAGRDQPWHWGYYSCNGFTPDVPRTEAVDKWGGITPLWDDLMSRHQACPMHALVGGGDQLYNDDVLTCPALQTFFNEGEVARSAMAFSPEMQHEVEEYYFHHYSVHFAFSSIGAAMASIPSVMSWDDHDIFDGWGSYPEQLHESEVFQGIFHAARRFYLLFQMHTTPDLANFHGCFGKKSFNQLVMFGPRVAVALPDCRTQRTENQVLSFDTHMNLIIKVDELPDTVRHLVLGTTVPIVYPHLVGGEAILTTLGKMNKNPIMHKVFESTGIAKAVFNDVDEPELLDDLRDHWSAPTHQEERRFLVEHLQMLAKAKNMRVSIVSGDVHLAATGRLYSYPKPPDLRKDFRFMPQIVCSAIGNAPPPDGLVKVLHVMGHAGFTNKQTKNKMVKLFDSKGKHRLLNRRNWCEVWEVTPNRPSSSLPDTPGGEEGSLVFALRVETFHKTPVLDRSISEYQTLVPVLEKPKNTRVVRDFYANKGWSKKYTVKEEEEHKPGTRDHKQMARQLRVGARVVDV